MAGLFKDFLTRVAKDKKTPIFSMAVNFAPFIAMGLCASCGVYGLGGYAIVELAKGFKDNLKKNKIIEDPYDIYARIILDEKKVEESDYKKYIDKKNHKISDDNSLYVSWKNTLGK